MQNKCNCQNSGFVPVSGNWDFSMNGDCGCNGSGYNGRVRRRSNNGCKQCGQYENDNTRDYDSRSGSDGRSGSDSRSDSDCQCERCNDSRTVACCNQNTYVRDMDDCECSGSYTRNRSNDCGDCDSASSRNRSGCGCDDNCECENCSRTRSRRSNDDCDTCSGYASYTRGRSGCNGCDKDCGYDGTASYARERSGCGCEKSDSTTYARSGKNRGVGMMKGYMQEIDEIFESESALRAGTIFPELHKPLNGYCPYDGNCGTCAQAAAFAAWELRLYLNTHPDDEEAMKLFRKLCKEAEDINYATTFLKDEGCTSGWNWVRNPWPWEYDCQCGD